MPRGVPKWMEPLTKEERTHVRSVAGCRTLAQFKRSVALQEKWRAETPDIEPCWDCKFIARKLDLIK